MAGHHVRGVREFDVILEKELSQFLSTGKRIDGNLRTLAIEIYDKYPGLNEKDLDREKCIESIRSKIRIRLKRSGSTHAKTLTTDKFISMIKSDKKIGATNWREVIDLAQKKQEVKRKGSWTQTTGNISLQTKSDWIIVQPLSDTHIGAFGTDYKQFIEYTDFIKKNKNIYTCFIGDMTDHFVNFKNVSAMHGQILSPQEQLDVFESWVDEIYDKILFATWCNHSEMEEKMTGFNSIKRVLERKAIYFNGIGKCNLRINGEMYQIVATHKTRYFSSFNLTHGLLQLARKDVQGADIYIGGDKHEPAITWSPVGGKNTILMQLGTLKTDDTYSKRYFSFQTSSEMPCFALNSKAKRIVAFPYLKDAIEYIK